MIELGTLMFEIGILMLIAFLGALMLSRFGISLIIAYIFIGIFIGPNISFNIGGFHYQGLIEDTEFINQLAYIGLILLLFFIGLGFSMNKLKKTKEPAIILAMMNLGINMFVGISIGTFLGWPLIDTIFLAGVISMSSSAVTAKSLMDMKKLSSVDTEFLLGVVIIESFLAMFLLTIIHGLVIRADGPGSIVSLVVGVLIFLGFFVWLSVWLVPRVVHHIEKIKNEELFLLFALGTVFLSAALAEVLFIPAIIGAFFIGMVFADTRLSKRMADRLSPLRDVFVAIFFISFGMMIDPGMFPSVVTILAIAVPLIILNDILITSALAYSVGFSRKGATFLGTALIGMNEESVFYATIGTNAINNNPNISHDFGGRLLNPFAGLLCIVMSSLTPVFMKRSEWLSRSFTRVLPKSMKFGGNLISRTVKALVMPTYLPLYKKDKRVLYGLLLYFVFIVALIASPSIVHLVLTILVFPVCYLLWKLLAKVFRHPIRNMRFSGFHPTMSDREFIEHFVLSLVVGALLVIALLAAFWMYWWQSTIFIIIGYFIFAVLSMKNAYRQLIGIKNGRVIPAGAKISTNSSTFLKRK
jgi:CPA2 family monovalent cation:H+ antiporter-2